MSYFVFVLLLAAIAGIFADTASDFAQTPTSTMQAKMVSTMKGCPISGTSCGKLTYYTTTSASSTAYWLENPPTQQAQVYIGDQWITTNGAEITMTQALVEPLAISFPCSLSVSSTSSSEPYLYTVVLADIDGAVQATVAQSESWQLWTATNYYCNANGGFCESNVKIGTACTSATAACSPSTWITAATTCSTTDVGSDLCMGFTSSTSMNTYTMTIDKVMDSSSIPNLETALNTLKSADYKYASGERTFTIDSLVANTTATPQFTTVNFKVSTAKTTVTTDLAAAVPLTFDVNTLSLTIKSATVDSTNALKVNYVFNEVIDVCKTDANNCGTEMKTALTPIGGTFATSGYLSPPSTANSYTIVALYTTGNVPTTTELAAAVGKKITPTKLYPNVVTGATETGTSTVSSEAHRLMLLIYKQKSNTVLSDARTSPVGTNTYKHKGYTPDAWAKSTAVAAELDSTTPVAGIWFYATKTF